MVCMASCSSCIEWVGLVVHYGVCIMLSRLFCLCQNLVGSRPIALMAVGKPGFVSHLSGIESALEEELKSVLGLKSGACSLHAPVILRVAWPLPGACQAAGRLMNE